MFKVINRNTRTRCVIFSRLTKEKPELSQWRRSGFFIVNYDYKHCSVVSIADFEQVNVGCVKVNLIILIVRFHIHAGKLEKHAEFLQREINFV